MHVWTSLDRNDRIRNNARPDKRQNCEVFAKKCGFKQRKLEIWEKREILRWSKIGNLLPDAGDLVGMIIHK